MPTGDTYAPGNQITEVPARWKTPTDAALSSHRDAAQDTEQAASA